MIIKFKALSTTLILSCCMVSFDLLGETGESENIARIMSSVIAAHDSEKYCGFLPPNETHDNHGRWILMRDFQESHPKCQRPHTSKEFQLLWAVRHDDLKKARTLLLSGADPRLRFADDYDQASLLIWAARNGQTAMAALLIEHGCPINARSRDTGFSALHEAVRNHHQETVRLLLDSKADVSAESKRGWTPINIIEMHLKKAETRSDAAVAIMNMLSPSALLE